MRAFANFNVVPVNLPCSFRACTVYNSQEDWYTIIYNINVSEEVLLQAYYHELKHIEEGDFNSMLSVSELENIMHK